MSRLIHDDGFRIEEWIGRHYEDGARKIEQLGVLNNYLAAVAAMDVYKQSCTFTVLHIFNRARCMKFHDPRDEKPPKV